MSDDDNVIDFVKDERGVWVAVGTQDEKPYDGPNPATYGDWVKMAWEHGIF